jgi:hypothetical protein
MRLKSDCGSSIKHFTRIEMFTNQRRIFVVYQGQPIPWPKKEKTRGRLALPVSRRTSKETFQRPRREGAIRYHLEEEKTPV